MQTEGSCLQLFTHKYTKETSPVCISADDASHYSNLGMEKL